MSPGWDRTFLDQTFGVPSSVTPRSTNKGYDVFLRDIIEPLEFIGLKANKLAQVGWYEDQKIKTGGLRVAWDKTSSGIKHFPEVDFSKAQNAWHCMASRKYPYSKVTKVARSFSSHNLQRTCGLSLTKTTRQCFADHPDGAKEFGRRGFSTGGGIVGDICGSSGWSGWSRAF